MSAPEDSVRRENSVRRDNSVRREHEVLAEARARYRSAEKAYGTFAGRPTGYASDTLKARFSDGFDVTAEVFQVMMDNAPFVCSLKDEDGRYIFCNQRLADRMGITPDAWIGRTDADIFPTATAAQLEDHDRQALLLNVPLVLTEEVPEPDGSVSLWKAHKFVCADAHGRRMLACIIFDVTEEHERQLELARYRDELKVANEQLRELVVTDALTGLRNRRAFDERLEVEFSRSRRGHRPLTLVLLDIDNFKLVNDRFGHAAGDATLCELGRVLQGNVRLPDLAARYGGEEFAVILAESTAEDAEGWANRLVEALAGAAWPHQAVTVSLGIAQLEEQVNEPAELIHMADKALYNAKRAGRARTVVYGRRIAVSELAP